MKVPQTFRPEKDLSKKVESLLEESELRYNPRTVEELLSRSEQFSEKTETYDKLSQEGAELVRDLKYTLKDVEELSKRIETGQSRILGIYLSALINKVITEKDKVTLTLEEELDCIGMYLKKGTIIVRGNTNDWTGEGMEGGELIVEGNTNDFTGRGMKGGKLIVEGNTNDWTGGGMEGGKLIVRGNTNDWTGGYMEGGKLTVRGKIASISKYFRKGTIIQGTETVRKA